MCEITILFMQHWGSGGCYGRGRAMGKQNVICIGGHWFSYRPWQHLAVSLHVTTGTVIAAGFGPLRLFFGISGFVPFDF